VEAGPDICPGIWPPYCPCLSTHTAWSLGSSGKTLTLCLDRNCPFESACTVDLVFQTSEYIPKMVLYLWNISSYLPPH